MYLTLADLQAAQKYLAANLATTTDPTKWAISSVDKSWVHYKTLDKFRPGHCWQISYYEGEQEWNFLVSELCTDDQEGIEPWTAAGATSIECESAKDFHLFFLTIHGKPITTLTR